MEIKFSNTEIEEILVAHVRSVFLEEQSHVVEASVPYSSNDYTVTIKPKETEAENAE